MKALNYYIIPVVGRLVRGSICKEFKSKKQFAEERVFRSGPLKGQRRPDFWFEVAYKKGAEKHWSETEWGAKIKEVAVSNWGAQVASHPSFSWKITDGDSTVPKSTEEGALPPCQIEGFAGHWVVSYNTSFPPIKTCDLKGKEIDQDFIKLGDYVEVLCCITQNDYAAKPGLRIEPKAVAFRERGLPIESVIEVDLAEAGFGAARMPAGAELMSQASTAADMTPPPAPTPYEAILTPPPAPAAKRMTPKATASYEAYISIGWTDDVLIAQGLMYA